MNRFLFAACVLFLATSPNITHAAVFERDWQTPGDGLLTFDDMNRREWLDLSETILEQFPGTDLEARYQSVVGELVAGGIFDGFSIAKSEDVIALAQSAGIDTGTDDFSINQDATMNLIGLLTPTVALPQGYVLSIGFLDELPAVPFPPGFRRLASIINFDPPNMANTGDAGIFLAVDSDGITPSTTGVMLFRSVVPEPPTDVLALFLIIILGHKRISQ
jgi:hypothetical protein